MYGPMDLWYHVDCFIAKRDELEFTANMDPTKLVLICLIETSHSNVLYVECVECDAAHSWVGLMSTGDGLYHH